jgi:hypothetical protein
MSTTRPKTGSLILIGTVLAVVFVGTMYLRQRLFTPKVPPVQSSPTTAPATQPATQPIAAADLPPRSYMDLIRRTYPKYPTTQPLDQTLGVAYMGRFILPHRAFLDGSLRLWVTHPEAAPTEELLAGNEYAQVVLTRERPVYVHWMQQEDNSLPHLVVPNARADGFDMLSRKGREPIGRGSDYDWERAFSWDEAIVVPRSNRVSVFFFASGRPSESLSPVLAEGSDHAPVEIAFANGPLAWVPPTETHAGSAGAVRCIEDAWFALKPEDGWPTGMLHLVPLLDGSILQLLVSSDDGTVKLNIVPLDPMGPDEEKKLALLIVQLSDPDADKRDKAYEELTRYGPGLWSVAERMLDGEPPETQARLNDLLRSRITPLLGGMQLVGQKLRVVSRHSDGGALFFSDNGVVIPQGQQDPLVIKPAWLSVRPGTRIQLLPQELTKDLNPSVHRLTPWSREWVVSDDTNGPRRFLGGELVPLLRRSERPYSRFTGIASGGRWIFHRERPTHEPTSQPTSAPTLAHSYDGDSVLIIDPRLPDPRPHLPVWQLSYEKGQVGWDKNNWPATKSGGAWTLGTKDWRPIDESKEPFFTKASDVPAPPPPPQRATTRPATKPTTTTATTQTAPDDAPLLVDAEGNYYFDGTTTLRVLKPDGSLIEWPLPPAATGDAPAFLVRSEDGALFLFNRPGRVLRLRPTDDPNEPFSLEATFTRNIPDVKNPTRIWLDPFDRIILAQGTTLTILFPKGYVPSSMSTLMTAQDESALLEEE